MYGYRARISYTSPLSATEFYEFYEVIAKGDPVIATLAVADITARKSITVTISLEAAKDMARSKSISCAGRRSINLPRIRSLTISSATRNPRSACPSDQPAAGRRTARTGAKNIAVAHPFFPGGWSSIYRHRAALRLHVYGHQSGGRAVATQVDRSKCPSNSAALKRSTRPPSDGCRTHWAVGEAIEQIEQELDVTVIAESSDHLACCGRCGVNDKLPLGTVARSF